MLIPEPGESLYVAEFSASTLEEAKKKVRRAVYLTGMKIKFMHCKRISPHESVYTGYGEEEVFTHKFSFEGIVVPLEISKGEDGFCET